MMPDVASFPLQLPRELGEGEFRLFQRLVYREAGIFLGDAKRTLVAGRLSGRLRELGLRSYSAYHRLVAHGDGDELATMLDCICTNETHFFREGHHFDFLAEHWLPARRAAALQGGSRRIHIWSAGCSSGEEPYSLAMLLLDKLGDPGNWDLEILATDLSRRVLNQARLGVWTIDRASEIREEYRKRFMLRGTQSQAGWMKAGDDLRKIIRFARLNLNDSSYEDVGVYDLIFCRNVLIYFDTASRTAVINRLLSHLHPNGYFFLGHSETVSGITNQLRTVAPSIYTHVDTMQTRPLIGTA